MQTLDWGDAQRIAEILFEETPDLDPTTLRLEEVLKRIQSIEGFIGDVALCNEVRLEAILQAWIDEYE